MLFAEIHHPSQSAPAAGDSRWHACYTRGRHERKVASHLDARRIETFLPMQRQDVQWSDRRKTVDRPLFPSYVFARFPGRELPQVLSTRGLVTVLRTTGGLAVIPDAEIENLRRFAAVLATCGLVPERVSLADAGDSVRVVAGPFAGITGVVVRRQGRNRLRVSLGTVGEGLLVDVDDASLQVTGPGARE